MYKRSKGGVGSRKHAASKVEETAARLSHWAQAEMGWSNRSHLPSNDEIKMYVLNGSGSLGVESEIGF